MPPTRQEQLNESEARSARGVNPGEDAAALDVVADTTRGDLPDAGTPEAAPPADDRQAMPRPRIDDKRNAIIERFRNHRTEEAEDVDQISDFQRSGLPQEFGVPIPDLAGEEAPAIANGEAGQEGADLQAQPQEPAPQKRKLKIRGEEREYTEEEIIAAAQKSFAAENYLDEAKSKLGEVDELLKATRNSVQHPDQHGKHPAAQTGVRPGEPETTDPVDPLHPEDDSLQKAIEAIQYGDPADALALLDSAVGTRAAKVASAVVQNTLQAGKFQDEAARTKKVLDDFASQHPEIANDDDARLLIERRIYNLQAEDLKALGVDPSKLPTKTGVVTPADIAEAHRWYRTQNYNVRPPAVLLQKAHEQYLEKMGTPKPNGELPDPTAPKAPPRVEVRVDREQRRQAIPQQPSRSAVPRQPVQQQSQTPVRDRSDIVLAMKQRRGLPRGQAV